MVNAMVERATSDMLIGPDWAMNIEICDICNHDPAQAKDVVRGIKKRLGSKNPKVQMLALTLLETIVKNCGDIVHMHVADKDLPHEMVKIVKKKPDMHVKDKVLTLIDTWQEAFGGARARYPQYYVAFQDLLRLGAVFPQGSENSAPVFTPPQTHPLSSYPQNMRNPEARQDIAESSVEAEYPTMSLAELQNARGIMDVLAEMLNALDPGNKEGLKQEVIVDLVHQCRAYKQRVVHLINSSLDESLLSQGLTLNDDLQRVLAKHESIASGVPSIQVEKPRPEPAQIVVQDSPLIDTGDSKRPDNKGPTYSTTSLVKQLSLPDPPTPNGQLITLSKVDPKIDLLSGDDFNSPSQNTLALVPVGQPQPASPVSSQHNTLVDIFPESHHTVNSGQAYPSAQFNSTPLHPNGSISGPMLQQQQPPSPTYPNGSLSGPMLQQQQPSPAYGNNNSRALPPPPWEAELDSAVPSIGQPQSIQYTQGVIPDHNPPSPSSAYIPRPQTVLQEHVVGAYNGIHLTSIGNPSNQPVSMQHPPIMVPHPMVIHPQPMQAGPMSYMYPQQMFGNQPIGFGYGYGYANNQIPPQNMYFLQQSMTGLSLRNDSSLRSPSSSSSKPSKPEDKLFGDLVDMSKFKPAKTA